MRRFFQLRDDVTIAGRWHLGEVRGESGSEPVFDLGVAYSSAAPLQAEVTRPGRVLDFCLTSFAVPIANSEISRAVKSVAQTDVQIVPLSVAGKSGMNVLNALKVLPCLDERRSEFTKWTSSDHRADLAGQYRQVTRLVLDARNVPLAAHFFRVAGWPVALIVSEDVKKAMEEVGCVGAKFTEV